MPEICPEHGSANMGRVNNYGKSYPICWKCAARRNKSYRARNRLKLIAEAGGKCINCGNDDTAVLQFHHRNPAERKFRLSGTGCQRSLKAMREEAAKCDLLCANCHIRAHTRLDI